MKKNINLIVEENENNFRVDVLINKKEGGLSRTRIKNLILKEKLKLNNKIITSPAKKVVTGDKLSLEISKPKNASKADKIQRKSKAVNEANNPNLSAATLGVIDSFFKED